MKVIWSAAKALCVPTVTVILGLAAIGSLGGCGGGPATETAAPISPEMEKKTNEMLNDYGKMYNKKFQAEKGTQKRK